MHVSDWPNEPCAWCRWTGRRAGRSGRSSTRGRSYAVFEADGELHVTDGACPHNGGPLAEGLVRDGVVTCPWHWYSYELATGRCRTAAGYELRRYPVVLVGGRPHAAIPAPEPVRSWSEILRAHARTAGPRDGGAGGPET